MACKVFKTTKMYDLIHELGICGCGCPKEAYEAVHKMLIMYMAPDYTKINDPHELFMAYTLDNLEFLEHGSSIYGAWLTDKGKGLLAALDFFKSKYAYDWNAASNDMPNEFWVLDKEI